MGSPPEIDHLRHPNARASPTILPISSKESSLFSTGSFARIRTQQWRQLQLQR
jgi:hypothetical protein